MNIKDTRILEMLIRVRQFGAAHSSAFPDGSRGAELFALVAMIIAEMEGHATSQDTGRRAAKERTVQTKAALQSLRADLEALSRTARAMKRTTPGIADKFQMPRSSGAQASLIAARSFATNAEPLKDEFIRRGMSPTFREDLGAKIEALSDSIGSRAEKAGARVAATVAISEASEKGRDAVGELDAVVRNVFREDHSALAEWESASHVERAPHHAAVNPPAPNTPAKE
ncbi:MAG TPA: hypothetical protein VFA21_14805 [Pyrinomonadaceae bacterium]|nr:hypothetical protein [Pyrinomonadaceae bacterium]